MNVWSGIGNVGADPVLRQTASGRSVLNFNIAVDRIVRVDTAEGPRTEKTPDWIPVVVFGDAAEHQARYLQKGTKVAIIGSLRPRTYADKSGATHHTFEVHADTIDWLANVRSPTRVAEATATA
jgi:single-strand DNA-binding protein